MSALPLSPPALGAAGEAVPVAVRPGQVSADLAPDENDAALVLTARGVLAGGLQAEQLTRAAGGPRRAAEGLACSGPQTDTWFAGGALGAGETATLLLANPEDVAAVVDVQVWTAQGPVDPRLGRGIVVPARGRTTVGLDTLAAGATGLAVHVSAGRGRVVAALEHVRAPSLGADWVPATPPPAPRVVLAALPAGPGERTLLVTNPGDAPTVVQVQLTTDSRQYVPTGLDALAVPGGTTVQADLTGLLAATPGTVAVTSAAGPVLAVGRAVDGGGTVEDLAYAGAAAALTGPALLPDTAAGGELLLSALAGDAGVVVTPLATEGTSGPPPAARTVAVPGGSTLALPLADLGGALEVTPAAGSGPVRAAAYLREDAADGPLTTLLALASTDSQVPAVTVASDPGAAVP